MRVEHRRSSVRSSERLSVGIMGIDSSSLGSCGSLGGAFRLEAEGKRLVDCFFRGGIFVVRVGFGDAGL